MLERLYHHGGLSLIIGWMVLWPLTWFDIPLPPWALIGAVIAGALLRTTKVGNWTMAIIGHLSFSLVLLVVAWFLARLGVHFPPTPLGAFIAYLALSILFYLSIGTLINLDIYALFYRPVVRFALTAAVLAYCLFTGDLFVILGLAGPGPYLPCALPGSNLF